MAVEGEKSLITDNKLITDDKLNKLAELMRDLRELAADLHSVCSLAQPDASALADLLCRRQQLMNEAAKIDLAGYTQIAVPLKVGEGDLAMINHKLGEIRCLLEETALLDNKAKTALAAKREQIKLELAGLRAGRAAGKAYQAQAPQEEGFFIDSREN